MKTIFCTFLAGLFVAVFSQCNVAASEKASEEYVFALEVEGQVSYQMVGDKGETIRKNVRRMQLISPGTVLEIAKDASVSLTCPGCNVLSLSSKDSPYIVKMSDFKQVRPISSQIAKSFWQAVKNYISPETTARLKVETGVRASWESQQCQGFWPSNNEKILLIAENIIFEWDLECNYFVLEIKDFDTKDTIFSEITKSTRISVPVNLFKAGKRYEWFLVRERPGKTRHASFMLLTENESTRIMKTFHEIPSLLPSEADNETRYRLQAGYLFSEGFNYAALQWLRLKGVSLPPER
jgi:hypothetical protein